jgi:hypothetical protein
MTSLCQGFLGLTLILALIIQCLSRNNIYTFFQFYIPRKMCSSKFETYLLVPPGVCLPTIIIEDSHGFPQVITANASTELPSGHDGSLKTIFNPSGILTSDTMYHWYWKHCQITKYRLPHPSRRWPSFRIILSRVWVTIYGVWIRSPNYWPFTTRSYN